MMRRVAVLGSTGSIGTTALKVLARHRDEVVIASKFGFAPDRSSDGSPGNARAAAGRRRRASRRHIDFGAGAKASGDMGQVN